MSPRKLKLALFVSLALNMLVIGAVAGAIAFGPRTGDGGDRWRGAQRGGPPELMAFSRALDAPRRKALRDSLTRDPMLRQGRQRVQEGRRAVLMALRAEPFEADALRDAMLAQRGIQDDLAKRGIERLVEVVDSLSAEERAAFVEALEETLRTRRRR